MRNTPTARASAGFEPAGMLRARTFPLSISSSRGGRCFQHSAGLPDRRATVGRLGRRPRLHRHGGRGGAWGQKMSATSSMSNRDRKLEMPSTHEVRSFGSSFIQSWVVPGLYDFVQPREQTFRCWYDSLGTDDAVWDPLGLQPVFLQRAPSCMALHSPSSSFIPSFQRRAARPCVPAQSLSEITTWPHATGWLRQQRRPHRFFP